MSQLMINERMRGLGEEPSAIRTLFAYGLERKAQIGEDKVFDYSIGNPGVPAPQAVSDAIVDEVQNVEPLQVQGYTPSQGAPFVREAMAQSLRERYGCDALAKYIYMISGAAAGIAISLSAVCNPGDEVIVFSPYFPEYKVWIETAHCKCVPVLTNEETFQIDLENLDAAINERTKALIINSPNNPTGAIYSRECLEAFAEFLRAKEQEYGHTLYLISDEPYRELSYEDEVCFVPSIYNNAIVCYSYSKSLSLPGARIGYLYVSTSMDYADDVFNAVCGAGRALGYICAPALFQRVVARCVDVKGDLEFYRENRRILTEALDELGYEYIKPQGAFYLWVKALEDDAQAFSDRAKDFELLIVPSDSFGVTGWVRMSYCIKRETIVASIPALAQLKAAYE